MEQSRTVTERVRKAAPRVYYLIKATEKVLDCAEGTAAFLSPDSTQTLAREENTRV